MTLEAVQLSQLYPKLKFLVIDDFESFRSSIRLMLSSFGAQHVDMANSAEDALEKCKYEFYDIILCDYNLGDGKNGQQILVDLRLNKRLKHIHLFIMITAQTAKDVVLGAREYLPDGYIAKPLTRPVLEQRLSQLIQQQEALKPINNEIDLNNHTKAISLCHHLLSEDTRYKSWCLQTLGKLYLEVGDTVNAIKIYANVLSTREISWALFGMGQALVQEQKYKQAIASFESTIQNNPNMVEAYDYLSRCHLKLGHKKEAQKTLEDAVILSPRMVPRQEKLGSISNKNNDIKTASEAYRNAIEFSENSIHDKPENYLNLGRCLSDWSDGDLSDEGKEKASEAVDVLNTLSNKFSNNEDACLNATLIEARVHFGQECKEAAEEKLYQAECFIEEDDLSAEVGLEFSKTLYSLGQQDRAEKLLIDLAGKFENQAEIIARIEELLDEPEGIKERKQAQELNKSGITAFEQGKMDDAIEAFESALIFTPKHAALNLNIVQVISKHYKENSDPTLLKKAKQYLKRIQHIPKQHNQYKRMKHFNKVIGKLTK